MNRHMLPRLFTGGLADGLWVMPAAVLTDARQTAKSMLARELISEARRYVIFDDLDALEAARRDPEALVGGTTPVTLDEVQRAPEILQAVKRAIAHQRGPVPGFVGHHRYPGPDGYRR